MSDEESSDSEGYLDDFRSVRGERREYSSRSLRSSRRSLKSSPPRHEFDDESENFSRNGSTRNVRSNRERRAGSATRSISSRVDRADKKSKKNISDATNTPDSDSELGTRAKVQAKIKEKIAQQQSSLDESSSDFWKPKSNPPPSNAAKSNVLKNATNGKAKKVSTEVQTTTVKTTLRPQSTEVPKVAPIAKPETKPSDKTDPLGPPPKTPNFEWECEFCTFSNEANTKICAICCKTPTKAPLTTASTTLDRGTASAEPSTTAAEGPGDKSKGMERKLSKKISFWPGTKTK